VPTAPRISPLLTTTQYLILVACILKKQKISVFDHISCGQEGFAENSPSPLLTYHFYWFFGKNEHSKKLTLLNCKKYNSSKINRIKHTEINPIKSTQHKQNNNTHTTTT
jgi:hypothetical protein